MNKNYTTRNFNVLSTKGDFKLFHDYLIDYNVLEKEKQYHFDIVNLSNEDKLNMLVDCVYELSMFKNRLQTTTEKFKALEVFSFKTMFVNVLEIVNILKPYVLESDFLNKMNVKNYFRAVFDEVMIGDVKYKTKEYDILELLDYFNKKEKEYDTKASFYTAKKTNEEKHYTDQDWFIVGLKFADGSVYENENRFRYQSHLIKFVFGDENYKRLQPYVNQSLKGYDKGRSSKLKPEDKNIFHRKDAKQELKKVYDYCIEKKITMHPKFEEQYFILQS